MDLEAPVRKLIPAVVAALAVGVLVGHLAHALPGDNTFLLEQHDRIIAESPGCYASCQALGLARRCTIREPDCRAVCVTIPECKADGFKPVRACAVIKER
jgi:hypothetical protein